MSFFLGGIAMDNQNKNHEKILRGCQWVFFIIYVIFLLRITFFKQVTLNNLFSAIGASERTISIIPFQSIYDMAVSNTSIGRIIENVLGNIVLFIPFGILFPIISNKKHKEVLCAAIIFSLLIEITQFLFALGSTDVDDLIFNVLGAYIGYFVSDKISKQFKSYTHFLTVMTLITAILGASVFGYLLVYQTDLFIFCRYDIDIENSELVEIFIDTPATAAGRYVELDNCILKVEKSVKSANDIREIETFKITEDWEIFICYDRMEYFFSAITGEYQKYEKIDYDDFISQTNYKFDRNNNVRIWSDDEKNIKFIVITEWVE